MTPFSGAGMLGASGADFTISQTVDLTSIVGFDATDVDAGNYSFNTTAVTTADGRFSVMMPHAERVAIYDRWKVDELDARWKALVKQHHPDRGGDTDTMATITAAYQRFEKERGL